MADFWSWIVIAMGALQQLLSSIGTTAGGPTLFVEDSFTEASDVNLSSHTGELGATWTHHPHANYAANVNLDAANDRIYGAGTSAYYASGTPPSADYFIEGDFYHVSTIAVNIAVCGRMHVTDDTMYLARLTDGATWQVRKIVTASATTLGSSTNQIPTVGNFKRGKLVMAGDQISFYVEGVLEIGPITDSAITAAGKVGVRSTNASAASTGIHLDTLTAGA
jgi:hypothetical protein